MPDHPLIIAWRKWFDSADGRQSLKKLGGGQVAENELFRAFHAGIEKGCNDLINRMCKEHGDDSEMFIIPSSNIKVYDPHICTN